MNDDQKQGDGGYVKAPSGLYVPHKVAEPCVEKAEFAVKVAGFAARPDATPVGPAEAAT